MKIRNVRWGRTVLLVVLAMTVFSFLPMVRFWIMPGASLSDNNLTNIEKLKKNDGVYFSFIVFGDNHSGLVFNDSAAIKQIWHMNREDRFRKVPIDFVLSVGDLTLDGEESHFKAYKKIQELIKFPVIAAIGNHDDLERFQKYCGPDEFTFSNRNSYFIVMNNKRGNPSEEQFEWLEKELAKGKEYQHTFVTLHKPPFDPYQQEWYNEDNSPWAYRFRKLCAKYGVRKVFAGHKHMFKSEIFDGVEYIVTGGGGMLTEIPDSEGGYHHYVRVMVNNDYVTYEVRKVTPPLWQMLTYYIWKEMVYWARNWYGSGYILGRHTKIEPERVQDLNKHEYWFRR
ncbi:MAG: metallophosphoesterase [Candidatus Omnitrophota bacterium]